MDRKENMLREAFPKMPEDIRQALMNSARSVKEEEIIKRFPLRMVALTALILVMTMALAYAAFYSQVADFFGRLYGQETQVWLEQGKAALPEDGIELSGVTFRMKEVVYQNRGLYGLVEAKGEQAGQAQLRVNQIGVDEGEPLPVKVAGYGQEEQADGSVLHSFEVSDALVIGEGEYFALHITAMVGEEFKDWLVHIKPDILMEQSESVSAPEDKQQVLMDGIALIVPDEYSKTGTLPVYRAEERNFGENIRPELFNQSGVLERTQFVVTFRDGAVLDWAPEALFYNEYQGAYNGNYKWPDMPEESIPLGTLSKQAGNLASSARFGWYQGEDMPGDLRLHQTSLTGITLKAAEERVEELLFQLDVTGYTRVFALDMDVARIQALGESMNRWILREGNPTNAPVVDYSKVTKDNEGYYLVYENAMSKGSDGAFGVSAYVTKEGIVTLSLRDAYKKGELVSTPDKLVAPETVLTQLPKEIARSRFADMTVKRITSIRLVYAAARDSQEGIVMTPAWLVNYYDTENEAYEAFAVFNAVDGSLLSAMFI